MVTALGELRTTGLNLSYLRVINSNKQAEKICPKSKSFYMLLINPSASIMSSHRLNKNQLYMQFLDYAQCGFKMISDSENLLYKEMLNDQRYTHIKRSPIF